jgi:hypothetical protein
MQSQAEKLGIKFSDASAESLPPISLQSFVKADAQMPGIAITDYDKYFTNRLEYRLLF